MDEQMYNQSDIDTADHAQFDRDVVDDEWRAEVARVGEAEYKRGRREDHLKVTCHELLLCVAALESLSINPDIYPLGTIAHRTDKARACLRLSSEGRTLLEGCE